MKNRTSIDGRTKDNRLIRGVPLDLSFQAMSCMKGKDLHLFFSIFEAKSHFVSRVSRSYIFYSFKQTIITCFHYQQHFLLPPTPRRCTVRTQVDSTKDGKETITIERKVTYRGSHIWAET